MCWHISLTTPPVLHDSVLPKGLSQLPLTCHLIHYSLPSTVSLFRQRMALLLKAFRKVGVVIRIIEVRITEDSL